MHQRVYCLWWLVFFILICSRNCNQFLNNFSSQQHSLHQYVSHGHTSLEKDLGLPSLLTETESNPRFANKNAQFGLDIVFINLDTSWQRQHYMRETLRFYGFDDGKISRISAFRPENIVLDPSLLDVALCNRLSGTEFSILMKSWNNTSANNFQRPPQQRVFVDALCGRKKNSVRELTVTLSHLLALHHTLYNSETYHPYALVLEDDMHLFMEVDFEALINSAPSDFSILQLVTSNDYSVSNLWRVFLRHKLLWVKRKEKDDYWCAGAYLIRKNALAPIVQHLFSLLEVPPITSDLSQPPDTLYRASVVAAYSSPCFPKYCCQSSKLVAISDSTNSTISSHALSSIRTTVSTKSKFFTKEKQAKISSLDTAPACIRSPRGYQSDAFLFSMASLGSVYMLTVPIFSNSETGNVSTVHQRHVAWHQASFRRGRKILTLMLSGKVGVKLPMFFNPQCRIGMGLINYQNNTDSIGERVQWETYWEEREKQEEWIQGLLTHRFNLVDA